MRCEKQLSPPSSLAGVLQHGLIRLASQSSKSLADSEVLTGFLRSTWEDDVAKAIDELFERPPGCARVCGGCRVPAPDGFLTKSIKHLLVLASVAWVEKLFKGRYFLLGKFTASLVAYTHRVSRAVIPESLSRLSMFGRRLKTSVHLLYLPYTNMAANLLVTVLLNSCNRAYHARNWSFGYRKVSDIPNPSNRNCF